MSARAALVAAAVEAVGAALADVRVFDAPPVRGALPHAVIEEPVLADWSHVGVEGREGRLTLSIHDAGERPVRLRALAAGAEAAVAAMAVEGAWRLVWVRLVRSRLARSGGDRWTATSEFAVRMVREGDE